MTRTFYLVTTEMIIAVHFVTPNDSAYKAIGHYLDLDTSGFQGKRLPWKCLMFKNLWNFSQQIDFITLDFSSPTIDQLLFRGIVACCSCPDQKE